MASIGRFILLSSKVLGIAFLKYNHKTRRLANNENKLDNHSTKILRETNVKVICRNDIDQIAHD